MNKIAILCTTLILLIGVSTPAWPHEGEQHGTPAPLTAPAAKKVKGIIRLNEQAKKDLGIRTEMTELRPIVKSFKSFGIVEAIPDNVNIISAQSPGKVIRVLINQGDFAKKDNLLAEIESRQIGDPPPVIKVHATISGIVTERNIFTGESVDSGKVLFRITDLSKVYVKAQVYEQDIGKITKGQHARFNFEAYPDRVFTGTTRYLAGELDEKTQSLPVWFIVENPELELRPNMRAEAHIITRSSEDVLTVPISALLEEGGRRSVYVEDGDIYRRKAVVTGRRDDHYVEIIDGLIPGDVVVTQGNQQLQYAKSSPEPNHQKPVDKK